MFWNQYLCRFPICFCFQYSCLFLEDIIFFNASIHIVYSPVLWILLYFIFSNPVCFSEDIVLFHVYYHSYYFQSCCFITFFYFCFQQSCSFSEVSDSFHVPVCFNSYCFWSCSWQFPVLFLFSATLSVSQRIVFHSYMLQFILFPILFYDISLLYFCFQILSVFCGQRFIS